MSAKKDQTPEVDLQAKVQELESANEMLLTTIEDLSQKLETSEKSKETSGKVIVKIGGKEYISKVPALRYANDEIVKIEDHTQEQLKELLKLGSIFEK